MPMLPSNSSALRHRPAPGTRSNTDRSSTFTPCSRATSSSALEMSMPREKTCRSARATQVATGPAPDVERGPTAWSSARCSAALAAANQRCTGRSSTRPSTVRSCRERCRRSGAHAAIRASATANGDRGDLRGDRARVVEGVDVALRSELVDAEPERVEAQRCRRPVSGVDIGTPRNAACGPGRDGSRCPVPTVDRRPEHRVGRRERAACARVVEDRGVIWGVSIPTTSMGPSPP